MALEYNIKATMNITGQDVDMNMVDQDFDSSSYDMLLYGFGDFISGNLQVDASNQDNFKSNVTVNTTSLGNLKLLYVDKNGITIGGSSQTSFGNGITITGAYYGAGSASKVDNVNIPTGGLSSSLSTEDKDDLIPLVDLSDASNALSGVNFTGGDTGDALLQVVNAALFRKLGKEVAILNDSTLKANLKTQFVSSLNTKLAENGESSQSSEFFSHYLTSGRFQADTVNYANAQPYNTLDAQITGIFNISGSVVDENSDFSIDSTDKRNQIFTADSKVDGSGDYSIKCMVVLRQTV
jgi:hypothetical protein